MKAESVNPIKNQEGKIIATPKKYRSSDRKNGFREMENIPVVTSFPGLFLSSPKRSEVLKCCKVIIHKTIEIRSNPLPINRRIKLSNISVVNMAGNIKIELPSAVFTISKSHNKKTSPNTGKRKRIRVILSFLLENREMPLFLKFKTRKRKAAISIRKLNRGIVSKIIALQRLQAKLFQIYIKMSFIEI